MGRLTKQQIEFIRENVDKMTNQEMANKLGCCKSTISNWRKKMNITFSDIHDFSEYTQYIIDNYDKKTSTALAKEIGCSKSHVSKIWRENNLKGKENRTYYSNFDYFEKIDTANKAYIVGVVVSDGCIYKREGHQGSLHLTVEKSDKVWLEEILEELESNAPIKDSNNATNFTIVSEKIYQDLLNLGILPNKTYESNYEITLSKIPKKYWIDFLHGYFDGDGSITVRSIPSKSKVQFAIPERIYHLFQNALREFGIESNWNLDERFEKYTIPFGNLVINGASNKYCLLKLFQLHNTISLNRKARLGHQLCEQIQSNITNRKENKTAVTKWEELLENLR